MGLDYGSTTVGVALTDGLGMTVQPLETITREKENHLRKTLSRIEEIISDQSVDFVVLGKPVHMDGSEGERVDKATQFKEMLERRTGKTVVWQDERLTTIAADEILEEMNVPRQDRKKYIDKIAAAIILEDYLHGTGKGN